MADYKENDGYSIGDMHFSGDEDEDDVGPKYDDFDDECRGLVRLSRLLYVLRILKKEEHLTSPDIRHLKNVKGDRLT